MVKIVCDFSLPGEDLSGWVVRGKPYSHTHTKILQTLSDLYMLLALYCCALVSDLPLNKQKIADLFSELKISYFFFSEPTARFKACSVLSPLSKKAPATLSTSWLLS